MLPRIDLLRILANHLLTVPPEEFDMGEWWCGTVGCALGHAHRVWPDQFEIVESKFDQSLCFVRHKASLDSNYRAAMTFFDLTIDQAEELFSSLERRHWLPKDAAQNILDWCNQRVREHTDARAHDRVG